MRRHAFATALSLVFFPLFTVPAVAGGFLIYEQGAGAQGMGGAFVSVANDPSAVYYNPAGLAFQHGLAASAGMSLVLTDLEARPKEVDYATGSIKKMDAIKAKPGVFPIPFAYISASISDDVAVGIGAFPHLGLGISWPGGTEWDIGRQEIEKVSIQVLTINPCVAWKPVPWLSFGLGFDAAVSSIEFQRAMDFLRSGWNPDQPGGSFGRARLGGTGWGFGMNFGVLVKPADRVSIGFSYRSRFSLSMSGRGDFQVPDSFADALPDQDLSMEMTMPDILGLGIGYRPVDWLLLQLEATQVMWSTYDVIEVELHDTPENNMKLEQHFMDAATFRLGAELDASVLSPILAGLKFRTGVIYDLTPVPSTTLGPALPDGNRIDWTVGLGYVFPGEFPLSLNLGYILIMFERDEKVVLDSRGVPVNHWPAAYKGVYHSIGLDLSYRFDIQ